MKVFVKNFMLLVLFCFALTASGAQMEIQTADDWRTFASRVNGGENDLYGILRRDIDLGTISTSAEMVGVGTAYGGSFYGEGHTLTYTLTGEAKSLFFLINQAQIRDLKVKATCTDAYVVAALVYQCTGVNSITRVHCDVNFSSSQPLANSAGMVWKVHSGAILSVTDCCVSGVFQSPGLTSQRQWFGFLYNSRGTAKFTRCLYAGTNDADNNLGGTICGGTNGKYTLTDCYYQNTCGKAQGEAVTTEQMKSGFFAQKIRKMASGVWGQKLDTDLYPYPTTNINLRVYQADYYWNTELKATRYANYQQHPKEPIVKNVKGDDYVPQHYYEPVYSSGYTKERGITQDCQATFTDMGTFVISTLADWNKFSDIMRGGQTKIDVQLANDLNLGTFGQADLENTVVKRVGTYANSYGGVLDGQGFKLSYSTDVSEFAPFDYIEGCTIKNLCIEGTQHTAYRSAGLARFSKGAGTVIRNVTSVMNMYSSVEGTENTAETAGLIYYLTTGDLLIEDCKVVGIFNGATDQGRLGWSGFVFKSAGSITLRNSLYAGTNNVLEGNTLCPTANASFENCYFQNPCGAANGIQATEVQMQSGEITTKLQAGRADGVWGQTLGTDLSPMLTKEEARQVYAVNFTVDNVIKATRYANNGLTVVPPTYEEIADPELHYGFQGYGNGFTADTPITSHLTVSVKLDTYFLIDSYERWTLFADKVNAGQSTLRAKLIADIDIRKDPVSVGIASERAFSGIFYGNGHTIIVEFVQSNKSIFHSIRNAKIEDLNVSAKSNNVYFNAALVQNCYGNNEINRCNIEVNFVCSTTNENRFANTGGMVSCVRDGHLVVNDCLVRGLFQGALTYNSRQGWAGFVKDNEATTTLNNCFADIQNNVPGNSALAGFTFGSGLQLNNCHYTTPCGIVQGTAGSEVQLKNGYIAKELQAGRTDRCYWAQVLGEMPSLYREADKSETNYVYYDKEHDKWTCDTFRLPKDAPLPIGIDFTAGDAKDMRIFPASSDHGYTVCLPFDYPMEYGIKAYTLTAGNDSTLYFKEVSEKLTAYHPYYIVVSGLGYFGGHNLEVKAFNADALTITKGNYSLVGTVDGANNATAAAANAYILQSDDRWHKVTTDNANALIPPYRAYITKSTPVGAKSLSLSFDDEATGINGMVHGTTDTDGAVYNLQGQRVPQSHQERGKGVYVIKGKKIINK